MKLGSITNGTVSLYKYTFTKYSGCSTVSVCLAEEPVVNSLTFVITHLMLKHTFVITPLTLNEVLYFSKD